MTAAMRTTPTVKPINNHFKTFIPKDGLDFGAIASTASLISSAHRGQAAESPKITHPHWSQILMAWLRGSGRGFNICRRYPACP